MEDRERHWGGGVVSQGHLGQLCTIPHRSVALCLPKSIVDNVC